MQEKVPEPERCTQASVARVALARHPAGFACRVEGSCLWHCGIHHTKLKRFHLVRLVSGHLVPCAECAHHSNHAQHWTCWTASQRHIDQGARSEAADLGASTWANRGVARVHFKQSCTGDAGLPVYPALAGRAHDHVLEIAVVFQVQCRPRQSAPGAAPGSAVAECSGPRAHAG